MRTVGAFEAKNTFGTLLDWVEQGEEVGVTRHGRAVARLVPNLVRAQRSEARAAADRILTRSAQVAPFNEYEFKADREMGRR